MSLQTFALKLHLKGKTLNWVLKECPEYIKTLCFSTREMWTAMLEATVGYDLALDITTSRSDILPSNWEEFCHQIADGKCLELGSNDGVNWSPNVFINQYSTITYGCKPDDNTNVIMIEFKLRHVDTVKLIFVFNKGDDINECIWRSLKHNFQKSGFSQIVISRKIVMTVLGKYIQVISVNDVIAHLLLLIDMKVSLAMFTIRDDEGEIMMIKLNTYKRRKQSNIDAETKTLHIMNLEISKSVMSREKMICVIDLQTGDGYLPGNFDFSKRHTVTYLSPEDLERDLNTIVIYQDYNQKLKPYVITIDHFSSFSCVVLAQQISMFMFSKVEEPDEFTTDTYYKGHTISLHDFTLSPCVKSYDFRVVLFHIITKEIAVECNFHLRTGNFRL